MDAIVLLTIFILTAWFGLVKNAPKRRQQKVPTVSQLERERKRPTISCHSVVITKNSPVKKTEYVTGKVTLRPSVFVHLKAASKKFIKNEDGVYENELKKASRKAVKKMQSASKHANMIVNANVKASLRPSINIFSPIKVCAVAQGVAITYDEKQKTA